MRVSAQWDVRVVLALFYIPTRVALSPYRSVPSCCTSLKPRSSRSTTTTLSHFQTCLVSRSRTTRRCVCCATFWYLLLWWCGLDSLLFWVRLDFLPSRNTNGRVRNPNVLQLVRTDASSHVNARNCVRTIPEHGKDGLAVVVGNATVNPSQPCSESLKDPWCVNSGISRKVETFRRMFSDEARTPGWMVKTPPIKSE